MLTNTQGTASCMNALPPEPMKNKGNPEKICFHCHALQSSASSLATPISHSSTATPSYPDLLPSRYKLTNEIRNIIGQRMSSLAKNISTKLTTWSPWDLDFTTVPARPCPPTVPFPPQSPLHVYRPGLRACLSLHIYLPHFRHSGSTVSSSLFRQACRLPLPVLHWT